MKNLLFLLPSLLWVISSSAQTPEKIYGKNKVLKPNTYYLQQMELWKLEVEKDKKNADAWYNYYRANRNAYIKGEEDNSQKSKGISRFDRLKNIVDEMEKQVPDSYEYHFVKWLNGNNDQNLFPFLEKAHTLSPKSAEPIMSLIFYYEIKGDYKKRDESIEAYYNLGEYSPGLLNYSYNLLSGLENNAIVFTEGDKDTEAILLLQKARKYRADVQLLNMNLLLIKEYRERIFNELGISQLDFEPITSEETYQKFQQIIIQQVANNKQGRPVYSAVTVSSPYTQQISADLYLTGLAYVYSTKNIDHITLLKKNVEQIYLLDYITAYFAADISVGNVNSMNGNYLIPFAALSKHYLSTGNTTKAEHYKAQALKVATAAERLDEYETYFGKEFKHEISFVEMGIKRLQTYTAGQGKNTIVFESGLGVDGSTWLESGIFDSISKNNQVIAYDRFGYGKSSQDNEKRGLQELVNDLDLVISKKSMNSKVIIVGHSLGGAIARAYAIQHPEKINALLFIEPNNENFKQYATMPQAHEDTLVKQFTTEKMKGAALEAAQLIENVYFLKKLGTLPNVPVIVITSTKTDSEMTKEVVQNWSSAHRSLGKGVTNFTQIKTNKSGHFVYLEEPNLIIENIRKLLK